MDGIGYAHAMPNEGEIYYSRIDDALCNIAPARQPKKSATIELRWRSIWLPLCVLESKRHAEDPAEQFRIYREAYNRRVRALLAANIAWTVVGRSNLDSPLQSGTQFDRALCLAIERRRCRMNRIKGEGKKYANSKRSRHK
jgi:hypothetical protein